MSLPFTDTFTQSTGSDQAITTYNAGWVVDTGGFSVVDATDDVVASTGGTENVAYWSTDAPNADQEVSFVISAVSTGIYPGVVGRRVSAGNYYTLYVDNGNYYVSRYDSSSEVVLRAGTATTTAAGDVFKMEISGTGATVTIKVYRAAAASPTTFVQLGADISDSDANRKTAAGFGGIISYSANAASRLTVFTLKNLSSGTDATVNGQTVTVTVSTIAGSVTTPDATVNGQTITVSASLLRGGVDNYVPEELFIFGDTDSNESSMGGELLFGGYAASGTDSTVNGQTITITGSIIPGTATGEQNATVTGQTITVNGSVIAGTASASSNATVNGQTITVNGSVIAGTASAGSSVAGQTITVNASVIPGSATGTGDASVTGQTITVNGSVIAGTATGSSNATVNGQTVAVTASLIAGAVTGDSSVAGQTLTVAASLIAGGVAVDSVAAGTVINIAASVIAGSASAPTNATVNGQTITINGSIIPGAAFGPSAGGQRWRSIGMHLGLRL